jgi:chemotaxis protein CheX
MKMDLIQPFISSLDAVLAEITKAPVSITGLAMEEEGYRRRGLAAMVAFHGQIEGRIILDMEPHAAAKIAECMADGEAGLCDAVVSETLCELANIVIGNAITLLNDRGFRFRVLPPSLLTEEQCARIGSDSEATILSFDTPAGAVHLNISMQYHSRSSSELPPSAVA